MGCLLFGFLRAGEFTCPSLTAYTPDMLSPADISVDSHSSPSVVSVLLKRCKNDSFAAGTTVYLGRTGDILCPVAAILAYIVIRPPTPGPLFIFHDSFPSPLSTSTTSGTNCLRDRRITFQWAQFSDWGRYDCCKKGHQ